MKGRIIFIGMRKVGDENLLVKDKREWEVRKGSMSFVKERSRVMGW